VNKPQIPFGSWPSPLSPDALAASALRLAEVKVDGVDIYWWEGRPTEGGRGVVVRRTPDGVISDATGADANVRTLVHEYGGGAWAVHSGGIYYVEAADQQIYHSRGGKAPHCITDTRPQLDRFADLTVHPSGDHLLAVMESHHDNREPSNKIVAINIASGLIRTVFDGTDFASSARCSGTGSEVAFITWSHPNMPWDETELRTVEWVDSGPFQTARLLVGGEALQQPTWVEEALTVVTDRTGWWLPHSVDLATGRTSPLLVADLEAGIPGWVFGSSSIVSYGSELALVWHVDGMGHVGWLGDGRLDEIETPLTGLGGIDVTDQGQIVAVAAGPTSGLCVNIIERSGKVTTLNATEPPLRNESISVAEHISFPSGDRVGHGLFYRPHSETTVGPENERPPLVVLSHGGPTAAAQPGLNLAIQFWTTRGFAVVDVNYGGSTGYGREYRESLRNNWGIIDVEDCIAAAQHLVGDGEVDGSRLTIKGGSAGGYTTLAALTFHDVFAAGASRYGIGDLESLARDTHKFESRYLDRLVGPYPEDRDTYIERSPIHFTEKLTAPMIILQGSEDKVVPPNQAEAIVEALGARGLAHAYVLFDGEQHGFRQAKNIARAVEAEYVFFCRVFGIEPSGDPEPLEIVGLS